MQTAIRAEDLPMYGIVLINDVAKLSDSVRDRLTELRKTGQQGQFVILGEYADLTWWGNYAALPVKPLQKITATRNLGKPSVVMTSFDRNHGIFKKFQNSAKFTLSTAQFYAYTQMELKPGATALVKFEDGSPAMAEFSGAGPWPRRVCLVGGQCGSNGMERLSIEGVVCSHVH